MAGLASRQEDCQTIGEIIAHHTLTGAFRLSGGGVAHEYIDLRSALLCTECCVHLGTWYAVEIALTRMDAGVALADTLVVATGAFGALLLGHLAGLYGRYGALWTPKGHGVEWSGSPDVLSKLDLPLNVVLVDDVVTTGGTLARLRDVCVGRGWNVIGEVVAVRAGTDR